MFIVVCSMHDVDFQKCSIFFFESINYKSMNHKNQDCNTTQELETLHSTHLCHPQKMGMLKFFSLNKSLKPIHRTAETEQVR